MFARRSFAFALWARVCFTAAVAVLLLGVPICTDGQNSSPPEDNANLDLTSSEIVGFLSETIDWYRETQQEQHLVTQPADIGFLTDNRRMAAQVVHLSFDFARAAEQRLSKLGKTPQGAGGPSQYETLSRTTAAADQLVQQTQTEIDSLKKKLDTAPESKRRQLEIQLAELGSELNLYQARQQALHGMLDFATGASSGGGSKGLRAQIDELANTVPAALSGGTSEPNSAAPAAQAATKSESRASAPEEATGIWSLSTDLFRLSSKRSFLSRELQGTADLQKALAELRAPILARLKQLLQSGDQLAKQADTSDTAALLQEKQELDALTTDFKQVSGLLGSLSKQKILLDLYKNSLSNWQAEVTSEFKEKIRGLLLRLFGLAIALGAVFLLGELWRRAIFRYVHDLRRRYQFLLMRRIAIWCGIGIVLIFAFVTELGAVATFAGLITAGVAVALQNVIVSIVGYFFLIGKFGIRVGDRVQVGGVVGEVVDIGLVRFHLMELVGDVADSEPTGRVVAFSNSVVFQSNAGLFKQIPGTNFIWREIVLKFGPDVDYGAIRTRLHKAVEAAFDGYSEVLERQRRQMELTLTAVPSSELKPRMRVRFTTSATEVTVRYPVVIEKTTDIDERVISEILTAVNRDPKLKLLGSEIPTPKTSVA